MKSLVDTNKKKPVKTQALYNIKYDSYTSMVTGFSIYPFNV